MPMDFLDVPSSVIFFSGTLWPTRPTRHLISAESELAKAICVSGAVKYLDPVHRAQGQQNVFQYFSHACQLNLSLVILRCIYARMESCSIGKTLGVRGCDCADRMLAH